MRFTGWRELVPLIRLSWVPALLLPLVGVAALGAQAPVATPRTILYPQAIRPWSTQTAIGFSLIAMPADIVQEAAPLRWPLFNFDIVMGLPKNFLLAGAVSSQIVSNQIEASAHWTSKLTQQLHADLGAGGSYWFGQLKVTPFNNTIHGTFLYPSVSLGYDFGTLAITAQAKGSIIGSLSGHSGSLEAVSAKNQYNGTAFRLSIEQPYSKSSSIGLSLQMKHMQFYYPQWPLFPTFSARYWIPEVQIRWTH